MTQTTEERLAMIRARVLVRKVARHQERKKAKRRRVPKPPKPAKVRPLTVAQLVLRAAAILAETFTLEELTISAWLGNPERFGLRGFEDKYPNHNITGVAIHGNKGLVRGKGYLAALANDNNEYRLTDAGRAELERMKGVQP